MDDCELLILDSNDQPSSSSTHSTNFSNSMSNSSIEKYTKESIMLALKYKKNEYTIDLFNYYMICAGGNAT